MRLRERFVVAVALEAFRGSRAFHLWLLLLAVGAVAGGAAYSVQLREGLHVTNMSDHVSWGIYIANFTFGVGVAAAAVMVVIPAYVYRMPSFRKIVFVGEILALSAVLVCLIFVTVDLGRPERAWHLVPFWGALNFPMSILSWDVLVLGGYFVINSVLITMGLRAKFNHRSKPKAYVPLIFGSMVWAVSIHTVTAFLYTWLGARPFWNSAIVAPRFIASAFVSGPAFLVLALRVIKRQGAFEVDDEVFTTFRRIMTITLLINLFLFASEVFTELYGGGSQHAASTRYLLVGHHEHTGLRIYVWTGLVLGVSATAILLSPLAARNTRWFDAACAMAFVGVWIEKGMALVVPGFIPTPLGQFVEYVPSAIETMVSVGVWCIGLLVFSISVRLGILIEEGKLRAPTPQRANG